ncbi:NAD(P)/FAD-dependent oxidoreductase [Ilumatobacter sp.]|uniref:NAD(P)/FAD-dependent oxidoreductase n=1 Tax=Ilumatobacter sp. TaxID=1967498 RepID=UPI00374FEFDB
MAATSTRETAVGRSLWADQVSDVATRASLAGDRRTDVAIVGAGYTGLWTAHSLLRAKPGLRVIIIEADHVGAGASGVNGGWCVGELAGGLGAAVSLAERRTGSTDDGARLTREIMSTVDEIGRVAHDEGIECNFTKGGVLRLARTAPQLARQQAEVTEHRHHGFGSNDIELLNADAATARLNATDVLGGMWYSAGARIHPARLVHGLAAAVERRGGEIVERTRATRISAGQPASVTTTNGTVTADVVVRAVEGFTRTLSGHRRTLLPFSSSMIATEPLPPDVWESIGLAARETFADDRRMVIYGQRTADDRIAFGGRGAPYRYGSKIIENKGPQAIHDRITATLHQLLPATRDAAITHRWGGVLGIPRDWQPSVGIDRSSGLAWAGGFVGEGVAASNLAGRTAADLILERDTDLVSLPWVDHVSPRWEPEPLRWLGVTTFLKLTTQADAAEQRTGRASRRGALVDRMR